jgi:hypothetical protein
MTSSHRATGTIGSNTFRRHRPPGSLPRALCLVAVCPVSLPTGVYSLHASAGALSYSSHSRQTFQPTRRDNSRTATSHFNFVWTLLPPLPLLLLLLQWQ